MGNLTQANENSDLLYYDPDSVKAFGSYNYKLVLDFVSSYITSLLRDVDLSNHRHWDDNYCI